MPKRANKGTPVFGPQPSPKTQILDMLGRMTRVGHDLLEWRRQFQTAQAWVFQLVWVGTHDTDIWAVTTEAWLAMMAEKDAVVLYELLSRNADALLWNGSIEGLPVFHAATLVARRAWSTTYIDGRKPRL